MEKRLDGIFTKNDASNIEQVLEAAPNKTPAVRAPTTYPENYPS